MLKPSFFAGKTAFWTGSVAMSELGPRPTSPGRASLQPAPFLAELCADPPVAPHAFITYTVYV